jgi:predicted hotdog family 3-hydroxylacyl-ACP dehydratase
MGNIELPLPAHDLIPHRKTMLLIETLLAYDQGAGAGTIFGGTKSGSLFAVEDEEGEGALVEEVVLLEMMAQAYACLRGYEDRLAGRPPGMGFLVGVRRLVCHRRVGISEEVTINVATTAQVETFFLAEAVVKVAHEKVAEAELKIWLPPQEDSQEES